MRLAPTNQQSDLEATMPNSWSTIELTDTSFAGDGGTANDFPVPSSGALVGFLDPAQAKRLVLIQIESFGWKNAAYDIHLQCVEDAEHHRRLTGQTLDQL